MHAACFYVLRCMCTYISVCMYAYECMFIYVLTCLFGLRVCLPLFMPTTYYEGREGGRERERESETETGSYVDWQVEALVSFCKHRGAVYISMILQWQVYVCKLHSVPTATYMPTSMHTSKQLCNAPYIDRLIDA